MPAIIAFPQAKANKELLAIHHQVEQWSIIPVPECKQKYLTSNSTVLLNFQR
jgi:hypothetical protein